MLDRDCSGYGVYEGAGAAMTLFQTALPQAPAPNTLAARLASSAAPLPSLFAPAPSMHLVFGPQPAPPTPFLSSGRAGGSTMQVMPFIMRPLRINFRLFLQPIRRRVQVPIPVPRNAPPTVRAAATSLVALPQQSVITLPGTSSSQQVLTMQLPGVPVVPGLPTVGFTQHGNLWMVDPTQLTAVSQVLGAMSYSPVGSQAGDAMGQLAFVPFQTAGNGWSQIQAAIAAGYAPLVEKASVPTGTLNLLFTQNPITVAQMAGGPSATHALIVDQPPALVDQADQALNPAQVTPTNIHGQTETGTCPPGTTGAPPDCVAAGAQQASALTPGGVPSGSWWTNLSTTEKVVGVGAVALVALALASRARKKTS